MKDSSQVINNFADRVTQAGVVGIVRAASAHQGLETARVLLHAGLDVVEVSLVTPDAVNVISTLVQEYPQCLIGAGTVMELDQARRCTEAGARLLLSPTLEPAVMAHAADAAVLAIPGVNTPTECVSAVRQGARLIKLFPASTWSPTSMSDLRSALPDLRLVPTGGVRLDDAQSWYAAGAAALGIGSALTAGDPQRCSERVDRLRVAMVKARSR